MQLRTFTVPFSSVVDKDARELDFAETDFMVVRPIFGQPVSAVRSLQDRLGKLTAESPAEDGDQLVVDLLAASVAKWSLDVNGEPVPMPRTVVELTALPAALRGALFTFLTSYRGPVDPTPAA